MGKRLLLVALIILVSGVLPLIANWGSCDDMPCCHRQGIVIGLPANNCCSPATCVKEEKALRADARAAQVHHIKYVLLATLTVSPPTSTASIAKVDPSLLPSLPFSTRERLSTLSVLLI